MNVSCPVSLHNFKYPDIKAFKDGEGLTTVTTPTPSSNFLNSQT